MSCQTQYSIRCKSRRMLDVLALEKRGKERRAFIPVAVV
jgi:hypothetical protein